MFCSSGWNARATKIRTDGLTLTLKFLGSLKTVLIVSACASMFTSWISPGSSASPVPFSSTIVEVARLAGTFASGCSASAAWTADRAAWRAGPGRDETVVIFLLYAQRFVRVRRGCVGRERSEDVGVGGAGF